MNAKTSAKKILVVTSDLPSHPFACLKLAKVLAGSGHSVTLASPEGPAYDHIRSDIATWSSTSNLSVVTMSVGQVATKVHVNVRPVINPLSYTALINGILHPFPMAQHIETMMDEQDDMYHNLKPIVGKYDLVFAIHSVAPTVCDAVESSGTNVPCVVFSSMPYDTSFYLGGKDKDQWRMPRALVALPHVATYSAPIRSKQNIISYLTQLFWMALDAFLVNRAWSLAAKRNDIRRMKRGLPPVGTGFRYYLQTYPVLSFGGIQPFIASGERIADNVTVVGSIDTIRTPSGIEAELNNSKSEAFAKWFNSSTDNDGIVFASFGTGTQLSVKEVSNIAKLAASLQGRHRLLLALRPGEQSRLRPIIEDAVGCKPSSVGSGYVEYLDGAFRIDSNIPQAAVLESGKVVAFVSHMGFGGFCETVRAGVPIIAYPSGCDQWYNAERAVEAGIALRPGVNMDGIETAVQNVLNTDAIIRSSQDVAREISKYGANDILIDLVGHFTDDEICSEGSPSEKQRDEGNTMKLRLVDAVGDDEVRRQSFYASIKAHAA